MRPIRMDLCKALDLIRTVKAVAVHKDLEFKDDKLHRTSKSFDSGFCQSFELAIMTTLTLVKIGYRLGCTD
jgi:hypothetical protein